MGLGVIKEFKCAAHGYFEGSHAICPEFGCASVSVERVFLTPNRIGKEIHKRSYEGMRKSAEMYGISDWKTARAGETSFKGRGQDAPLGTEVLWGNEAAAKMGGVTFAQQMAAAAKPLAVERPLTDPYVTHNNGMRAAATTLGLTRSALPPAEITKAMREEA
jgi:hypothetical protein